MTAIQKTLITVTLSAALGTGIYEAHQTAYLREQAQTFRQQQALQVGQIQQLQRERNDAASELAGLRAENEQLTSNSNEIELPQLRDEVARLGRQADELRKLVQSRQDAESRKAPVFSTNLVSRESWKFSGYATPEATIQSIVWAQSLGDVQKFLAGFNPEQTNAIVASFSDEALSKRLTDEARFVTGVQILKQFPLADDEVMVDLAVWAQAWGAPHFGDAMVVLKSIDGEWKWLDSYNSPSLNWLFSRVSSEQSR